MKRFVLFLLALTVAYACDNSYLESESKEELVVEGWIEDGHAPMVFVTSTMPVTSEPQPLDNIKDHILRYAEVFIDCDSVRYYLTARLTDKYIIQNYFTSSELRGEVGKTYTLGVKWLDYEGTATCTIPPPTPIDSAWFEKFHDDTSYVAKIRFKNNPDEKKYYQTFLRIGSAEENIFHSVDLSTLDGSLLGETITATYMKPAPYYLNTEGKDLYFHKGECATVKLATMEKQIYDFWASYANAYNGSSILTAPSNLKGNVKGAIGYWAGYGVSLREISVE